MARDFRIPRLYKTLLALAAVLGPIYWLMLTEDGQRRTDLALMWILGRPSFDAALESFTDRLTEARLRETFPALDLQCVDGSNPFGDRLCGARIGSFNQYPARGLTLFFDGGRLAAVKVLYPRAYQARIRGWVERRVARLGEGTPGAVTTPVVDGGAAAWRVTDGVLMLKDGDLAPSDEPALMWLSAATLAARPTATRAP
ncbi:MAG: hypothetical protein ACM3ST_06735 [Bdellovibrio bacteriovorus]